MSMPSQTSNEKCWVVCLNQFMRPTTWGYVISDGSTVHVKYGDSAPIWSSPYWDRRHVMPCFSEEEAEKLVRDEENRKW